MHKRLLPPLFALLIILSPLAALPDTFSVAAAGQEQTKSSLFTNALQSDCGGDQCG